MRPEPWVRMSVSQSSQGRGVRHLPFGDRPFEAVGIGEAAHREGGGEPLDEGQEVGVGHVWFPYGKRMDVIHTLFAHASVVMVVVVCMGVRMPVVVAEGPPVPVGPAFGGEGGGDLGERRAELAEHGGEHMVVADEEAVAFDPAGRVAVADVPGEAREVALDLDQRLGRGADGDLGPVVEAEGVAFRKRDGFGEVDEELPAAAETRRLRRRSRPS